MMFRIPFRRRSLAVVASSFFINSFAASGVSIAQPPQTPPVLPSAASKPSGLIVHEWGTFLSVQGADGVALGGMIDSEESLPSFVRERDLQGRNRAGLFLKMETPVTYFYTDRPMTAEIKVDMPRGLLTHWFPATQSFGPRPIAEATKDNTPNQASFLDWGKVELFPDTPEYVGVKKPVTGVRPGAGAGSTWRFARETDSALVKVTKAPVTVRPELETEKFLFYRGLGEFDLPLSVVTTGLTDDVSLALANRGSDPLTSMFVVRVRGNMLQYAQISNLAGRSERTIPTATTLSAWMTKEDGVRQVKQKLTAALATEGLYSREALAMTNTWEASYFQNDGLRVLYVLPRRFVDEVIPIRIRPTPERIERVMVGRVEVLTPQQEAELLKQVTALKSSDKKTREAATAVLNGLGRLKEPTLRRLLVLSTLPEQREQIQALLRETLQKSTTQS
ncbi:MAG: hypothetical protein ACRCZF_14275 [Gemmataceae bacterium]